MFSMSTKLLNYATRKQWLRNMIEYFNVSVYTGPMFENRGHHIVVMGVKPFPDTQ